MILRFEVLPEQQLPKCTKPYRMPLFLCIFGLAAFWLLAAIFEAIGFTKHRYAARGIAALLTPRWGMDRHGLQALVAGVDWN